MAEEQKYISKWCRGFTREQILEALHASGGGRARRQQGWRNLDSHEEPLLSGGDKCGWDAVNEVAKRGQSPDIITRFSKFMDIPVKVIHSSRNPLDNISAWVQSPKYQRMFGDEGLLYRRMIRRYKRFYEHAERVMEDQDVFQLRNEELIADPRGTIASLADWLELPDDDEWLSYCAEKVYAKPNRRHVDLNWPEEYVKRVTDAIELYPSLHYYRSEHG
jgi:hypothetical protein